jgi:uncharacterized protein YodC (DUF2158 family)
MANQFMPGDLVQLNSGGPKMSVRRPGDDNPEFVACFFFDGSKLVIAEIPPQALVNVQATSAS